MSTLHEHRYCMPPTFLARSSHALPPRLPGGVDGAIRVWNNQSHTLLAQFAEHKKPVTGLLIDDLQPHLVHSCGADKSVVTVDLQAERRITTHKAQEGAFTAMAQSPVNEHELLTCDTGGAVKTWDCDEADPVSMLITWTERDEMLGKAKKVNHLSLSPPGGITPEGGRFMVTSTQPGEVQVWDLTSPTAAPIATGVAHSDEVKQAYFTPDGKQIVSVGQDCCIAVWNFYA